MKQTIFGIISFFLFLSVTHLHATIEVGSPTITNSVSSLSDFKYTVGSGPSAEQVFTVSGINLTSNLVVSAPTNYEISPLSGASFISMNSIAIAHSAGTVSEIVLYVRLKSGLTVNTYTGDISVTSTGAITKTITLVGSVKNPPSITTSLTSISGLFSFYNLGQSIIKSFEVSGTELKSGIIITAPYNFQISRNQNSGFSSMAITIPVVGSELLPTTIYVRLNPYAFVSTDYNEILTASTQDAVTKSISLSGRGSYSPSITTSASSMTGFNYFTGTGPSAQQSFTLNGNYLIDNLTITAPTNFEISTIGGSGFSGQSSLTFNAPNYSLATKTIYVRLKSGLTPTNYSGNLTCSTSNATSKTIALSGTVSNQPMLNVTGSPISELNYNLNNGPSAEKSFTVGGTSLSSLVFIYAPINFEISTTSGADFSASNSIILPQSGGNVSLTTIYVRLKAGLNAGDYTENVTVASAGAANQTVSLLGTVVNPNATINVSKNSISNIDYSKGSGPSVNQNFSVSASGLTNNMIISATSNYEISTNASGGFNNTLTFNQVNGIISNTTIYVRLKSGLNVANYTGNISVNVAGSPTKNISLSGDVTYPAGINLSETTFTGMDYLQGVGPSVEKSFVISGSAFSSFIIISAPTNYELSTAGGPSFSATSQVLLQPVNGIVNETTIYVRLKSGLANGNYQGAIVVSSSNHTTKSISVNGTVSTPIVLLTDTAFYQPRNNDLIYLQNKWLFSRNMGNYSNTSDLLGNSGTVRSMAVRNGKMLFCSRSAGNQIISIDGKTGVRNYINLSSTIFTYTGRNMTNTADSLYSVSLPSNDIRVDKAGNVLLSNLLSVSSGRFQIWKIDTETGSGTLLIDQADFSTLFPGRTIKIETFNVLGNVNNSASIFAVCSSVTNVKEMYKWNITNGIASLTPELIQLDTAPDAAFGNGVAVFPIDEENFFIDGDKTMPFKFNINTKQSDSFKFYPTVYTDTVTSPMYKSKLSVTVNGTTEFYIGTDRFLIVGATNYNTISLTPSSTFRIYKYPKYGENIADLECLWTFPMKGMGTALNPSRMAISAVEVSGEKATIYVYYGENGYGVYELVSKSGGGYTEEKLIKSDFMIRISGHNIISNKLLKQIDVYTITGQLVGSATNTMSILKPQIPGVYIVKTNSGLGALLSQKIVIE